MLPIKKTHFFLSTKYLPKSSKPKTRVSKVLLKISINEAKKKGHTAKKQSPNNKSLFTPRIYFSRPLLFFFPPPPPPVTGFFRPPHPRLLAHSKVWMMRRPSAGDLILTSGPDPELSSWKRDTCAWEPRIYTARAINFGIKEADALFRLEIEKKGARLEIDGQVFEQFEEKKKFFSSGGS